MLVEEASGVPRRKGYLGKELGHIEVTPLQDRQHTRKYRRGYPYTSNCIIRSQDVQGTVLGCQNTCSIHCRIASTVFRISYCCERSTLTDQVITSPWLGQILQRFFVHCFRYELFAVSIVVCDLWIRADLVQHVDTAICDSKSVKMKVLTLEFSSSDLFVLLLEVCERCWSKEPTILGKSQNKKIRAHLWRLTEFAQRLILLFLG
jgi:hypothetical protein